MQQCIVRIQQIELIRFKNIEYGMITLPGYMKQQYSNKKSEIVGIYGQNGSGKTALVEALDIAKRILMGKSLPLDTWDSILQTAVTSELKFVFNIECEQQQYLVFYEVELSKLENNQAQITKESLSYKKFGDGKWNSKIAMIDFSLAYKDTIFKPIKNFKLLTVNQPTNAIELAVAKKLSQKNRTSFIFSCETEEIIRSSEAFSGYTAIIIALKYYATVNLFVIKNDCAAMINMDLFIPLTFKSNNQTLMTQADLGVGLLKPSVVSKQVYEVLNKTIEQMDIVLEAIIPGLRLEVENHGKQLQDNGAEGVRIELISVRAEFRIPLRYESDGIKKIISILSTLITMFNNPSVCMVVDELDAGVFEYLLGELLQIISQSGKGQLIFTSHNLRPLEMLDTNSIVFTTTNAKNRYLRFANVKTNNNLRHLYYRSINLGGQKEDIYEQTNSYEIAHAFRVARRVTDED
jgi:AAA15 family ATPase/GTPase